MTAIEKMIPEIEVLSGLNKIYLPREQQPGVCDAGDNHNSPVADDDADNNSHTNDIPSDNKSHMVDDNDGGDNSQPADRVNLVENRPERRKVGDLSWPTVLPPAVLYQSQLLVRATCLGWWRGAQNCDYFHENGTGVPASAANGLVLTENWH